MRIWGKFAAAVVAPLMLSGCLWGPGKFTSNLALNRAGTFVLDYRGEIMLQVPDATAALPPWEDNMATCYVGKAASYEVPPAKSSDEKLVERPCTKAELAHKRLAHETQAAEQAEAKRKENEEMSKLFGLPGSDDESNRSFAASLMRQKGWRSVSYKGKGLFDVDYHFEGRLDQDFAFPLMPDSDLMIPFITIRPRTDGSVKVSAPAFVGGAGVFAARARMMGLANKGKEGPVSRAEGRFTITTDGEILTNNSEEGPAAAQGRRQLQWDVGPGSDKVPEMMVKL